MTTTEHNTTVKIQRAWDEWRAECSCGWVGSYFGREFSAGTEAEAHRVAMEATDGSD